MLVLKDYKTVPDIIHEYEPTVKFGHIPLVIDNGQLHFVGVNASPVCLYNFIWCVFRILPM